MLDGRTQGFFDITLTQKWQKAQDLKGRGFHKFCRLHFIPSGWCIFELFVRDTEGVFSWYWQLSQGRMADFPAFIASESFDLWNHHIPQMKWHNLRHILMLWRQESRPFGPGWAVHITSICSWTFRLPCPRPVFFTDGYLALAKCEKCSFGQYEIPLMDFATFSWWILAVGLAVVLVIWLLKSFV